MSDQRKFNHCQGCQMPADCERMGHCHDALHANIRRILRSDETLKREARRDRIRVAVLLAVAALAIVALVAGAYWSCIEISTTGGALCR